MTLYDRMKKEIVPNLKKELGLTNTMAVPRITKVVVNVGIGTLTKNTKDFSDVVNNVANITGQKPVITKAKKAISNFKLRQGIPAGIVVTMRGRRAYDMVDRLVNVVIPRVRDFRGLSPRSFDTHGGYSVGFRDALVFPEINPDTAVNPHGVQVTIATTAKNHTEALAFFRQMGFPFKKEESKKEAK
jgi:large subunit ribosomal protein L5